MTRIARLALILALLLPQTGAAEPVQVSITALVPDGGQARAVSWSAVPVDLAPDADVLAAMRMSPEPVTGPWLVTLEPGAYVISGYAEGELYEGTVEVGPQNTLIEVPALPIAPAVAFRCAQTTCAYTDPVSGLQVTLPQGWAVDVPTHADLGGGLRAPELSTVFYEDIAGDGGAVWFLNPVDWISGETGPCRAVAQGSLCTFDLSPSAEAAFAVIAPSLQQLGPKAP